MTRKGDYRAINNFINDAKDAAKIAGSHVPVVKDALEGYEIGKTARRLQRTTPRAVKAVKRQVSQQINQGKRKILRNVKRRFGL